MRRYTSDISSRPETVNANLITRRKPRPTPFEAGEHFLFLTYTIGPAAWPMSASCAPWGDCLRARTCKSVTPSLDDGKNAGQSRADD